LRSDILGTPITRGTIQNFFHNEHAANDQYGDEPEDSDAEWDALFGEKKIQSVDDQEAQDAESSVNSMKSKLPPRLYYRVDIGWPVVWNYIQSTLKALGTPVSPVLTGSLDDCWLGKQEVLKIMIWDPFRRRGASLVDQVLLGSGPSLFMLHEAARVFKMPQMVPRRRGSFFREAQQGRGPGVATADTSAGGRNQKTKNMFSGWADSNILTSPVFQRFLWSGVGTE
jgi:hypothetical protein